MDVLVGTIVRVNDIKYIVKFRLDSKTVIINSMISKDEVRKIAELARIEVNENQIKKYQAELSAILDFVGELSKADTKNVESIRQITGLESVFKKDEDKGLLDQKSGHDLVKQAPEHKDGYVVVPEVLKNKISNLKSQNES